MDKVHPLDTQVFEDGATVKLWVSNMGEVCLTFTNATPEGEVQLLTRNARQIGQAMIAMADAQDAAQGAKDDASTRH